MIAGFTGLSLVILPIILLLCALSLHFLQHFRCRICYKIKNQSSHFQPVMLSQYSSNSRNYNQNNDATISSMMQMFTKNSRHVCVLKAIDGAKFKFFPLSFLLYMLFAIFLCMLIVTKLIITGSSQTDIDSFSIKLEIAHQNNGNIALLLLDGSLIYGVMILSIWESLHAFYTFYTTYFTTINGYSVSIKAVIVRFISFYGFVFMIIYILEICLLKWISIPLILLQSVFNLYCTLRFTSILITSYQIFAGMHCIQLTDKQTICQISQQIIRK